ncbi:MAG: ATP-binding cassette domain-containing protein, partial [Pseudomonadota bacterium]
MLSTRNLCAAYGQSEILHGLNVDVGKGEIVAIMGRNGMGKTTLMKTLMGIVPATGGAITVDGAEMRGLKSHKREAAGHALV